MSINSEKSFETEEINPEAAKWDFRDVKFAGERDGRPPQFVYRGVIVPFSDYSEINTDDDLVPPHPPKIDENGRETVDDGNEYGVYMTDNEQMALDVYGNPEHGRGKEIGTIRAGLGGTIVVKEPSMGLVYKINTEGIDVHKPWITGYLEGHYNNGYQGDEWVVERVPKDQCEIERLLMGSDLLHDEEDFTGATKEEIEKRFLERKAHLDRMMADLAGGLPREMKFLPVHALRQRLKEIYGDGNLAA